MTAEQYIEQCPQLTQRKAMALMREHGISWETFTAEMGDAEAYDTEDTLRWLGY